MRQPRSQAPVAPPLIARVKALSEAASLAAGRSDDDLVAEAKRVSHHVDRRLAFSGESTVVALAGATGSGKSSLFNAISGTQLARSGVRRPTTSVSMAAYWGTSVAPDLLAWLEVPQRHAVGGDARMGGLVLLDLPDHDSTQTAHRDEVDRLVKIVDGFIWVVDPQKYADNALYERYLRPLAAYADVMFVVLNQSDLLSPDALTKAVAHLRTLLDDAGLSRARLLTTSALTGQGIADLRTAVADLVASKKAAAQRLSTDVRQAAKGLAADVSRNRRRVITEESRQRLLAALQQAAGLQQVVEGAAQSTRRLGAAATGWPVVSWINNFRPDPLARLRAGGTLVHGLGGAVASAQLDGALRELTAEVTIGMKPGWATAVRSAAMSSREELPGELDAALAKVDLGVDKPMAWWRAVRVVQWVLILTVLVGVVWAIIGGATAAAVPAWHKLPWPVMLIVGGVIVGVVLALVSHLAVGMSAQHRASKVQAGFAAQLAQVADRRVIAPVTEELDRYGAFVACVARAL